jgi:hypothetical protein
MPDKWKHEELGVFTFNRRFGWVRMVTHKRFDAFTYDTGRGNAGHPTGKYTLVIPANGESGTPTRMMADVASKALAHPPRMVSMIVTALWEDFIGKGPDSRMWWHGNLKAVKQCISQRAYPPNKARIVRLDGPADLLPWMRLLTILIHEPRKATLTAINPVTGKVIKLDRTCSARPPLAEFSFSSPFEEEHGVGVLTDGTSVLGTGYSIDVNFFE